MNVLTYANKLFVTYKNLCKLSFKLDEKTAYFKCFNTARTSKIQPAIKLSPPIGVIAPSVLMPVIASA